MISQPMFLIGSLLLCAGLCNGACETSYEDVFTVDCSFSYLREVPLEEIPDEVQSLDLSNNELTKLKRSQWKSYSELETLYLTNNDISEIEEDAFLELKKLSNLDLSNNKLSHIPPHLFSKNHHIQYVKFSDNPGLYLPPQSPFIISQSLILLDMSSCHLTSLYLETFSKLNVEFLDLSFNNLEEVNVDMFKSNSKLTDLDLRYNKLKCGNEIKEVLKSLYQKRVNENLRTEFSPVKCLDNGKYRTLSILDVLAKPSTGSMKTIEQHTTDNSAVKKEVIDLTEIENQHIENTETTIHDSNIIEFSSPQNTKRPNGNMKESKTVSLFRVNAVDNGVCEESNEDVFTVDCTFSYLREVPLEEIPNDVQSLDLSNNELTELKRSQWKSYTALETLYLTDNEISEIEEDAFSDLKKLSNLDLSNNKLSHIPSNLFSSNKFLEHVSFSNNPGLYVPPNSPFLISQSVFGLDMSSCNLISLYPETFTGLPNLVSLDLRYNNLEKVDLEMFKHLETLNSLDLRNNRWKCDCDIVEVLSTVTQRRVEQNLHIEFPHVKCLSRGIYKPLWTASSINKICEFKPETYTVKIEEPQKVQKKSQDSSHIQERNDKRNELKQNSEEKVKGELFGTATNIKPMKENTKFFNRHICQQHLNYDSEVDNSKISDSKGKSGEFRLSSTELILLCVLLPTSLIITTVISVFLVIHINNRLNISIKYRAVKKIGLLCKKN